MFRLTRMKLDRAKQRMKELEEALQSFYATNPFKFSGKADLQAGKVVYTMDSVKDAPDEASLIAGEIIQNLRSALDHLAYQLFLRAGGTGAGKNIYFPIGGSKTSYENKKSSRTYGMTQQAVAAIDALKPYKGGNDVLWQLHELNNVDKHRLILTVGSAVRSTDLGDYFVQCAAPAFFMAGDNDYPLKVCMVVFTDQTTMDVKKLTIRFELVLYEKGVIEGVSLSETRRVGKRGQSTNLDRFVEDWWTKGMARQVRIQFEGAVYHVMARGDRRESIIGGDEDRRMFIETFAEACEKTGWLVDAWVLMTNHYHLVLRTPQPNLVAGMRWLQNTYTRRFNVRNRLWGHVFGGRYKAVLVESREFGSGTI